MLLYVCVSVAGGGTPKLASGEIVGRRDAGKPRTVCVTQDVPTLPTTLCVCADVAHIAFNSTLVNFGPG